MELSPMTSTADRPSRTARAAAVAYVTLGGGFGVGAVVTLRHLERHGELPMTPFGFRSLSGPFPMGPSAGLVGRIGPVPGRDARGTMPSSAAAVRGVCAAADRTT
jgi:hypothetical protein